MRSAAAPAAATDPQPRSTWTWRDYCRPCHLRAAKKISRTAVVDTNGANVDVARTTGCDSRTVRHGGGRQPLGSCYFLTSALQRPRYVTFLCSEYSTSKLMKWCRIRLGNPLLTTTHVDAVAAWLARICRKVICGVSPCICLFAGIVHLLENFQF